jgi:hypothetical protein
MNLSSECDIKLDQFIADKLFFHLNTSSLSKSSLANNTGLNRRTIDKLLTKEASLESIDSLKLLKLLKIVTKNEFERIIAKYKNQIMSF